MHSINDEMLATDISKQTNTRYDFFGGHWVQKYSQLTREVGPEIFFVPPWCVALAAGIFSRVK
jgi:hypothetical protein